MIQLQPEPEESDLLWNYLLIFSVKGEFMIEWINSNNNYLIWEVQEATSILQNYSIILHQFQHHIRQMILTIHSTSPGNIPSSTSKYTKKGHNSHKSMIKDFSTFKNMLENCLQLKYKFPKIFQVHLGKFRSCRKDRRSSIKP